MHRIRMRETRRDDCKYLRLIADGCSGVSTDAACVPEETISNTSRKAATFDKTMIGRVGALLTQRFTCSIIISHIHRHRSRLSSTASICCGIVERQITEQIHNRSKQRSLSRASPRIVGTVAPECCQVGRSV